MGNTGNDKFMGFMLQARDPETDLPVGSFTVKSTEAQTVDCSGGNDVRY
jgi:Reeler domain